MSAELSLYCPLLLFHFYLSLGRQMGDRPLAASMNHFYFGRQMRDMQAGFEKILKNKIAKQKGDKSETKSAQYRDKRGM